ncbi:MAG: preprotein translocase subunit SecA [Candidatus Accumulibacter phosphatis]|uniref:Protein translocase subunit SecA n=1 Tax=Candidatus Accumulibacter cognatus TaxID=2954383 RepID=A0A080ML08_9PROT|nr:MULTISPECIES: preprotein translocase subunit SecA [Candidatus Accumulibacter]MCC2867833.1 preprotein translocase subunit SecA [Candidatus Accumulibacter phosphatis]KFB78284.1 MAG: preprotein translocase subunit SecA [Candidatus Accumulibacter cognatus]MBN8516564.1 preprotein translocase subunit SecA [Accumulibacter sp.]MBO3710197.1 preprotein translocase subunit SecA [Accumulibacter sp.]MCM8580821.1 preprotein translocase subunit SecA [Accumulibacter sp.]
MISGLLKKIFGSRNDRLIKQYMQVVRKINALEAGTSTLSDDALRGKTADFKSRVANGETLDALLPEAFAVVREAGKRTLGMRHFDVQLIGGMVLHDGKIAEMRTGEGKTLVATLASYLNALSGNGVHVVTVNDYLANRDAEWMGRLHRFLGLSVGVNLSQMAHGDKQAAYAADITYGTNNEFGFDYLRDNMVYSGTERVQRKLNFAIVDEVDSILIDEARTPLIISGQAEDHTELYVRMNKVAPLLKRCEVEDGPGDYWVDEKGHQILMTEEGHEHAEEILAQAGLLPDGGSLYDASNILMIHHLYAALRAHNLFLRDQQYVVQNGEVIIVDEFTGRLMSGRRWSDGLHQAVEAKEGVRIQNENQTLASITFQNYFRMYSKLSGMTGTADTEAYEFQQIYGLETVVIPTNQPMRRTDHNDQVFRTAKEKHAAIVADIRGCRERGQPVLVGTTSIENSELLSALLDHEKLPHQVLNAKQHAREAEIVREAGRPGMITIATNMAGRGTDIVLGGSIEKLITQLRDDEALTDADREARISVIRADWQKLHDQVVAAGGLHIIGSERHESRRIDNQLRGRSGRQGDPGSSRFYLALDDSLLRIFAGDRLKAIMERLKMPDGEAIEHPLVSRSLESAQRKVEARNFDIRKQLLEYDDVANDQRKVIYAQRNELLETDDISETVTAMREGVLHDTFRLYVPADSVEEQWDLHGLERALAAELQLQMPMAEWSRNEPNLSSDDMLRRLIDTAAASYAAKIELVGADAFHPFERNVMLQSLDTHWREHLAALDHLRQGIHLRGYAQKNPKQEYKREAFELFERMLDNIRVDVTRLLVTVQVRTQDVEETLPHADVQNVRYHHADYDEALGQEGGSDTAATHVQKPMHTGAKVGRNEPCPCGSGKKYKYCHGKLS